jgi:hypothetical protein
VAGTPTGPGHARGAAGTEAAPDTALGAAGTPAPAGD